MKARSCIILFFTPLALVSQELESKLDTLNEILPTEKIYIHTDRTFYSPEDTVWFSVYILNGEDLQPSLQSKLTAVQLLDAQNNVIKSKELTIVNGTASGNFELRENAGGLYKIKAFTNWSGNFSEDAIFTKELLVQKIIYPSLLLKIEPERKSYLPGQTVNCSFSARDLSNQPI